MQTIKERNVIHVDTDNSFGQGIGALISYSSYDPTKVHIIANSISDFLERHYARLKSNYYYNGRGKIESYPNSIEAVSIP
jgi:hypothetical protein